MGHSMLRRALYRSLRYRASRVGVAVLAVVLGGSLVAALGSLSLDIGSKAGRELRAYGANIVIAPRAAVAQTGMGGLEFGTVQEELYLAEADLAPLAGAAFGQEVVASSPYLYGVAEARARTVTLVGVRFAQVQDISPWWHVEGEWASDAYEEGGSEGRVAAMAGIKVAASLGLQPGGTLEVRSGDRELSLKVSGIVETGADEDRQLFVPLTAAQRLLDRPGLVSVVQVSGTTEATSLATLAAKLEGALPGSRARVVGQIADAEAVVLAKVRLLMGLVATLVLLAAGLAVGSTMTAGVLERTREIGVWKALGAEDRQIALLFLLEATSIAVVGAAVGYLVGLALAAIIGYLVFSAAIAPSPMAAPLTLGVALVVCLVASVLPVRQALSVDPATTLRGE